MFLEFFFFFFTPACQLMLNPNNPSCANLFVIVLFIISKCRQIALDYWKKVGFQWESENEDDLKDKKDFGDPYPSFYPAGGEVFSQFSTYCMF